MGAISLSHVITYCVHTCLSIDCRCVCLVVFCGGPPRQEDWESSRAWQTRRKAPPPPSQKKTMLISAGVPKGGLSCSEHQERKGGESGVALQLQPKVLQSSSWEDKAAATRGCTAPPDHHSGEWWHAGGWRCVVTWSRPGLVLQAPQRSMQHGLD